MKRTLLFAIALLLPVTLGAQEEIEFSGHTWSTAGTVQVEDYLGRPALRMRGGRALLNGVEFTNGTIEFDIAVSGYRSFVGLQFRSNEAGNQSEFFYLRPHQTGRFDALQYTPVENGISAWQLFPEYNAEVMIPADQWIHVRLVVAGSELTAFVGNVSEPAMEARLATDRTSGGMAKKRTVGSVSFCSVSSPETRSYRDTSWCTVRRPSRMTCPSGPRKHQSTDAGPFIRPRDGVSGSSGSNLRKAIFKGVGWSPT